MKNLSKSITLEVLGDYLDFNVTYTVAEMRKLNCRYIGTDMDTDISVYEIRSNGELIAVEG